MQLSDDLDRVDRFVEGVVTPKPEGLWGFYMGLYPQTVGGWEGEDVFAQGEAQTRIPLPQTLTTLRGRFGVGCGGRGASRHPIYARNPKPETEPDTRNQPRN